MKINSMPPLLLAQLWLMYHLVGTYGNLLSDEGHGACSRRCQNGVGADDQRGNSSTFLPFPCSCSSSCALYKDCCYDSPFRNDGKKHARTMCLAVSGRGRYSAVSECPRDWPQSSQFCTGSIGHLPPVTSTTTGTTYANIHCALCHGEETNLKTWNVELRCCREQEEYEDRKYLYEKGNMWSLANGRKCLCRFEAHYNDFSSLQNLELRTCDRRLEVAKCSFISQNHHQEQHECSSFLDPVYVGGKIYRNKKCAKCNLVRLNTAKCMPPTVETMSSMGFKLGEIYNFCVQDGIRDCLYYFNSYGRGQSRPFSSLLNINEVSCMPTGNNRCCPGESYDFRSKKCRKVFRRFGFSI